MCIATDMDYVTMGMVPYIDQNGKLQCERRLPTPPPLEMIPEHVIDLQKRYSAGELDNDNQLPRCKLYEARKVLRRYHLLPATTRRVYVGKSTEERRQIRREYISQRHAASKKQKR